MENFITIKEIDKMNLEFLVEEKIKEGYREVDGVPFYKENGYYCADLLK